MRWIFLFISCFFGASADFAPPIVPPLMSYGGRLTESNGRPLAGPADLTLRFYDAVDDGNLLKTMSFPATPLSEGVFQVALRLTIDEAQDIFGSAAETTWVEVQAGAKIYPRQTFYAVPYALKVPIDDNALEYCSDGRLDIKRQSLGDLTLGSQAALGLGTYDNTQETSLTGPGGLTAADKGKTWCTTGGASWGTPGAIGATTPNTGAFSGVSIGTSTPGTDLSFGSGASRTIGVQSQATAGNSLTVQAGGTTGSNLNGGDLILSSGTANGTGSSKIEFRTANGGAAVPSMSIFGNGSVGIGTAIPASILDLRKNASGAIGPTLTLSNNAGSAGAGSTIDFSNQSLAVPQQARIQASDNNDFSSNLLFFTKTPGSQSNVLTERMRISSAGNVAIGTTSTSEKLEVNGNATVNGIFTIGSNPAGFPSTWANVTNTSVITPTRNYLQVAGKTLIDTSLAIGGGQYTDNYAGSIDDAALFTAASGAKTADYTGNVITNVATSSTASTTESRPRSAVDRHVERHSGEQRRLVRVVDYRRHEQLRRHFQRRRQRRHRDVQSSP